MTTDTFDYVIVGAGTAGCILAARLTEHSDNTVCLLEAGGRDWHPFIHIPAGFMKTLVDPRFNWLYQSEPSEGTAGRSIFLPRGKTLGGSSAINGHIYNRGQRMDFDTWAQVGNRGWGYADVLPYFKRSERRSGGDDLFRGRDGPMPVTTLDWPHPLCEAFMDGAAEYGIPRNPDYNGVDQAGVNYSQVIVERGKRVSAARGYLHPALKRSNLHVRTNSQASRILLEDRRAVGVRYLHGGESHEVRARKEVILSGGAVNSPQLLQLSGVGAPGLLQDLGIEVQHALPAVGENLRDHLTTRFSARVKGIDSINARSRGLPLAAEIVKYALGKRSILNLSPSVVYLFWRSSPELQDTDFQMVFTPASYKEGLYGKLDDLPGMSAAVWQQRPESSGHVRITSIDPLAAPAIQPNYLKEEHDQRVVLKAMQFAQKLVHSNALKPYFDGDILPESPLNSDDEWIDYARQRGGTAYHLIGSCRMGPASDQSTVVDGELRVHGLEQLRVVDASVFPRMTSANTNAATMMVAEKAADLILGRAAPPPVTLND